MTLDFIISLPSSRWNRQVYNVILIYINVYTKMARYFPCHKTINAPELIRVIFDNIITKVGMFQNLINDYASLFTSKFWLIFYYHIKVKHRLNTTFYP